MTEQIFTLSDDVDVDELIKDYPLVIFEPRLRARHLFLKYFRSFENILWHVIDAGERHLPSILNGLLRDLREAQPGFGDQFETALSKKSSSVQVLANAFALDLKKTPLKYIFLDEFDKVLAEEKFSDFIVELANNLASQHPTQHIIINSRQLPQQPWFNLVKANKATVLGTEYVSLGSVFDVHRGDKPIIEVYALAGRQTFVNGLPMNTWEGPLPQHLFYYLLDHPMVTRDEIFETFWPQLPIKEATNVFHVTKRKIAESLGVEITDYAGGFYRTSPQIDLRYDVGCFETLFEANRRSEYADIASLNDALNLYRTPFLHQLKMPWIIKRRESLKLAYTELLVEAGRRLKGIGELQGAINQFLKALREVPHREDIHRTIMSLYLDMGQPEEAAGQYQMLSTHLERTFQIAPSGATRELYESFMVG
jgi:DNA-binding SARP family transcriptional activator